MSAAKDAVIAELKGLVVISKELQSKILGAKTNTKRNYFKKKLRKNNERVANLVMVVERMNQQNKQESSDNENGK